MPKIANSCRSCSSAIHRSNDTRDLSLDLSIKRTILMSIRSISVILMSTVAFNVDCCGWSRTQFTQIVAAIILSLFHYVATRWQSINRNVQKCSLIDAFVRIWRETKYSRYADDVRTELVLFFGAESVVRWLNLLREETAEYRRLFCPSFSFELQMKLTWTLKCSRRERERDRAYNRQSLCVFSTWMSRTKNETFFISSYVKSHKF